MIFKRSSNGISRVTLKSIRFTERQEICSRLNLSIHEVHFLGPFSHVEHGESHCLQIPVKL